VVAQGPKSGWGSLPKLCIGKMGRLSITTMWCRASFFCARRRSGYGTAGIHQKVEELNDQSCRGSEDRPLHRPQRSGSLHQPYGAAQSDGRNDSGLDHSVFVSSNIRGALIVAATIPFSLLFASSVWTCGIFRRIYYPGRAGFRHGGGWRSGDGGKHCSPPGAQERRQDTEGNKSARLRTKCSARCSTP